jgi:hypothetical protein
MEEVAECGEMEQEIEEEHTSRCSSEGRGR